MMQCILNKNSILKNDLIIKFENLEIAVDGCAISSDVEKCDNSKCSSLKLKNALIEAI